MRLAVFSLAFALGCGGGSGVGGGPDASPPVADGGTPEPETLVVTQAPAVALAVDADGIWWTAQGEPIQGKQGYEGTSSLRYRLFGGEGGAIGGYFLSVGEIELDGDDVFFVAGYNVHHAYKSDGASQLPSRVFDGRSVAVDADRIYVASNTRPGSVWACPREGCPATPTELAAAETFPSNVRVHGGTAYWYSGATPTYRVRSCPTAGCEGSPEELEAAFGAGTFEVDDAHVYAMTSGRLERCPLAGCDAPEVLADTGASGPGDLALGDQYVYFAGGDVVARVARDCAAPCDMEVLAPDQAGARAVALDAEHVYWSTAATEGTPAQNAIHRIAR